VIDIDNTVFYYNIIHIKFTTTQKFR